MVPKRIHDEVSKVIEYLNLYICSFSGNIDSIFNDLDKIHIMIKYYGAFISALPESEIEVMQPEEITLVYIIHYLSSQTFDKKLKAINLLNSKIQQYLKQSSPVKFELRDILLRNGILKILYITGYHPEIARKSDLVFHFLSPVLKAETVSTLLKSAFEQGSDKGANLCRCIRQSLSELSTEVKFS